MSVDRSLKLIASALAIWSFTSLVATGQVAPAGALIVYVAFALLVFRGDLYRRISKMAWTAISVFVFLVAAICGYYDLGTTLVYYTVFLQIQKIVCYKSPRDYLWLFLLSFFQVVFSAAISVELSFVLTLLGFLGMVILAMALLTLERGRVETERQAARTLGLGGVGRPVARLEATASSFRARPSPGMGDDFLPSSYAFGMAAVSVVVVLVSALFFLAIPRLEVRKFFIRLRPFDTQNVAGFSEQVVLGRLSSLSANRAVVMRVWVNPHNHRTQFAPSALRLRGVALDFFDGNRWFLSDRVRRSFESVRSAWSPRHFPVPFAADPARRVDLDVEQYLEQAKWIFGPPFIAGLEFKRPTDLLFYPECHSFQIVGPPRTILGYSVTAHFEPPVSTIQTHISSAFSADPGGGEAESDTAGKTWTLPDRERKLYLQLPRVLPEQDRLQALAREVTKGARTSLERVSRLSRFFHEQFRYSLLSEETDQTRDYLVGFLFDQREGHCETFAAAMAVLCRLIGMPSRVVNGFYTSEFNRFEKFFYVRQNHAHTWVEVWLDGYGWLTADPTPPAALTPASNQFAFLLLARDYWDSWTVHWRRLVVDYSLTDQLLVLQRVRDMVGPLPITRSSRRNVPLWHALSNWMVQMRARNQEHGYTFHKLSLAGLVLAWVFYRRQQRRNGRSQVKRRRHTRCPVAFYAELLSALVRHGWQRQPAQTPAEFALAISAAQPTLAEFSTFTNIYYRIRFSGGALQADEQTRIAAWLSQLSKSR
jgi:hypothetical protein